MSWYQHHIIQYNKLYLSWRYILNIGKKLVRK